ncbi:MAG TPA: PKD domain-containing protein [Conexibacter sp.]|nr:PKD domain-containing protein [Conexibacter sp.]
MPAPRSLTLVRSLLLALAVTALAAACAQLARGADGEAGAAGASVTIVPPNGGAERTLVLADLAAQQDVHDAVYTLRAADGATSPLPVATGISLEALLRAAGLDGETFTYVEATRPDGSAAFVVRDQLATGDDGPPVVWSDEQGVHFLRPSTADDDPNAADHVVQAGGSLRIELRTGDPLAARIAASALRARPNEPIDFSATLVAGELGPGMSYQWYFDGGRYVYGASVTHRFPRPGRYNVLLNVVRGAEAVGVPGVVLVRIVQPRREREPDGARRSGESRDGSRRGNGAGGGSGSGTGAGASGGGSGAGAPGAGTPASPAFTPAPAPPAAPASVAPPPPPEPASSPPARRTQPAEPQGELVSGTLLASASGAPAPAGGDDPQAAASARDDAPADPLDIPIGVWIAIGLGAIVALGWTLESRHTLPFWQP